MTKLKKFRFLFKCFGLIGAICISLGLLDLKNVNAKNVSDTGTVLSVQDVMSNYNNASLETIRLFSHSSNGIMDNFDSFNTYYNFNYLPLFDYLSTTHGSLTGSDYYLADIGFNYNLIDESYLLNDYANISWSPLVNTDYLFIIVTFDTSTITSYGFNFYFNCSDSNYNSSTYFNLNTTDDVLIVVKPMIKDNTYSTDFSDYSCSCHLVFDEYASSVKAFSGNSLNGIYQYYVDYARDTNNAYDNGYSQGYDRGLIDGTDRTIQQDYQGKTYDLIYQDGYTIGESETVRDDYHGKTYQQIYNSAYNTGYNTGQASVSNTNVVVGGLFGSIANVPLTILNGLFPATILGVPIITVLLTFLSILVVIWLIKRLI